MFRLKYTIFIILISLVFVSMLLYYQNSLDNKSIINATFGTGIFVIGPGALIFVGNSGAMSVVGFFAKKLFLFTIRDYRYYDMDFTTFLADKNFVAPFIYLIIFAVGGIYLAISYTMLYNYNIDVSNSWLF